MISTFQALAVFLLALLPGASYTFALERQVGAFGVSAADRFVRFFAASAFFLAVHSGPAEVIYRRYVRNHRLAHGSIPWWEVEIVALAYVLVPIVFGAGLGIARNRGWRVATWIGGSAPEPRAWDWLWRQGDLLIVRMRLKSGTWLAGVYGTTVDFGSAYASGYPEAGDLCLNPSLEIDPDSGELARTPEGSAIPRPGDPGDPHTLGRDRVP